MVRRRHVMTPARKAALRKAQLASAKKRHAQAEHSRRNPKGFTAGAGSNRGEGVAGLQKNTIPYLRVNKRSQTGGFNTGTKLPGTGKRLVFGGYLRLESSKRDTATDKAIRNVSTRIAPGGTKRGAVRGYLRDNVTVNTPTVRANVGKAQVRLGSSRGAGPTVIVRRGNHKVAQNKTYLGTKKYDDRIRVIAKNKKPKKKRAERRGRR